MTCIFQHDTSEYYKGTSFEQPQPLNLTMSVTIVWDILVLVELYWATLKTTVFHRDHCNFRGDVGFVTRVHFLTRHIKLETTDPPLKTNLSQHRTYVSFIPIHICFRAFGAVSRFFLCWAAHASRNRMVLGYFLTPIKTAQ